MVLNINDKLYEPDVDWLYIHYLKIELTRDQTCQRQCQEIM